MPGKEFIPKPHCTNASGGCFTAGKCLFGCGGPRLEDMAMLIQRLARALSKAAPDSELHTHAMDYLKQHHLLGKPTR